MSIRNDIFTAVEYFMQVRIADKIADMGLKQLMLSALYCSVGRDSVIGIATRYELDGPGIEFRRGRGFPHPSRQPLMPTQPLVQ